MNYENIRISSERTSSQELYELFEADVIKKILNEAQIEPQKESLKTIFEGLNFKISSKLSPKLYSICEDVKEKLQFTDKVEFFIANSPTLNAFAIFRAEETHSHIIVLNSGLVEKFDDDELKFVIGHEIGHLVSENANLLKIINFLFPTESKLPLVFYNKISYWKKLSELTADRFGYIANPKLDKCITNFFKLSSGLDTNKIAFSPSEYLAEIETLLDKMRAEKLGQYFDHPVNPVRVKALRLFSESNLLKTLETKENISDQKLNTEIDKLCNMLLTIDDSEIGMHRKHFIASGGIIIAGIDKDVSEKELTNITSALAAFTVFPKEFLESVIKSNKVEQIFEQSIVAIIQMNPGERLNMFNYLIDIALSDNDIFKGEIDLLFTLGNKYFGLSRKEMAQIIASKIHTSFIPKI